MPTSTKLQSQRGDIKTIEEWMKECDKSYKELGITVINAWERFQKQLGLLPLGVEREVSYRRPVRAYNEGLRDKRNYEQQ